MSNYPMSAQTILCLVLAVLAALGTFFMPNLTVDNRKYLMLLAIALYGQFLGADAQDRAKVLEARLDMLSRKISANEEDDDHEQR